MLTKIWLENPKERGHLGNYARWHDKNEVFLEAEGWENKDCIQLAQYNDQVQHLIYMTLKFQVP
jgi:hypothetical protein